MPGLILLLWFGAFAALPAMRHAGYPMAVVGSAPALLLALWASGMNMRQQVALLAAPIAFALITEPFWGCDPLGGLAWVAAGPVAASLLGLGLGRWLRRTTGLKAWRFFGACTGLVLLDLAALGLRLYNLPQVMVMDPIVGYVHGPIYDAWAPMPASYVAFRTTIAGLGALFWWRASGGPSLARDGVLAMAMVAAWPGHYLPNRASLQAELSAVIEAPGLIVRHHPEHRKDAERIMAEARAHTDHLCRQTLGRPTPPEPITIWLYPDARRKKRLMGAGNVLIARPWQREIHLHPSRSPDAHLRHELVHVVLSFRSDNFLGVPLSPLPSPALIEGLAVYLAPSEQKLSLHQTAAALMRRNQLPDLDTLLSLRFSFAQGRRAYRAAGSLAQFVAQTRGLDVLLSAYGRGSYRAAGLDHAALDRAWRQHLATVPEPPQARRNLMRLYSGPAVLDRPCPHEVEAAWQHAQRRGDRSDAAVEVDYRAVMRRSGNCRALASLADRMHARGDRAGRRRIEDEMLARGLPPREAATLFERRGDEAFADGDLDEAEQHWLRAIAAAPPESSYRADLVRISLLEAPELLKAVLAYLPQGRGGAALMRSIEGHFVSLSRPAAAAAAYLAMRWYGNRADFERAETWAARAEPLPDTLRHETAHYRATLAERAKRPCLAARRWRAIAGPQPAEGDRLEERLARLRFEHPEANCSELVMGDTK